MSNRKPDTKVRIDVDLEDYYRIKRKPYGNNLLTKVKDEVKLVIEATPDYETYDRQKIIDSNKKNAVRHA